MAMRRTPEQQAECIVAEMERHIVALNFRNWKRATDAELRIFTKTKKQREVGTSDKKLDKK